MRGLGALVEERRLLGVWALNQSISVPEGTRYFHIYHNHVQLLESSDRSAHSAVQRTRRESFDSSAL